MGRIPLLFFGAILVGAIATTGHFWWQKVDAQARTDAALSVLGRSLGNNIFVRDQMMPQDVSQAAQHNVTLIAALRPDGEAAGQPSSQEMAQAAKQAGIAFHYIPVAPGSIPTEEAAKLSAALKGHKGPVILYCRSGLRAVRTWALAEAQNPQGAELETILSTAKKAGFTVDDLKDILKQQIEARAKS